ncbi:MAG: hypothetical protein SP4CHLAM5_04380 [Chlamydiia bacterium]|nr:hypothetical protein [Chlamydiia bacterium]MCH9624184.1 hypothetical protein [Chlamydiia bacterium]
MHRLILFLLSFTFLSSHEISISYFDKGKYAENNISLGSYPKKIVRKDIDAAYMLSLSYPLNPAPSPLSLKAGTSVARFDISTDEVYAYSTFFSARFTPFSLLAIAPFVEVSLAGPTYLSKAEIGDINFGGSVVYQNYLAAGFKVAAFIVDVKMLNYSTTLPTAFTKESVTMPFIASIGCTY